MHPDTLDSWGWLFHSRFRRIRGFKDKVVQLNIRVTFKTIHKTSIFYCSWQLSYRSLPQFSDSLQHQFSYSPWYQFSFLSREFDFRFFYAVVFMLFIELISIERSKQKFTAVETLKEFSIYNVYSRNTKRIFNLHSTRRNT